jgi:hypothetical protein
VVGPSPQYTAALLDHLCDIKICHWDRAIRELAARALCKIASACPDALAGRLAGTILGGIDSVDLNTRHGSVLAIGEAVLALAPLGLVPPPLANACADVVVTLGRSGTYRGAGGEMLRMAVCTMVCNLASSSVAFTSEALQGFQDHIDAAVVYDETAVQDGAIEAFAALCSGPYATASDDGAAAVAASVVPRCAANIFFLRFSPTHASYSHNTNVL